MILAFTLGMPGCQSWDGKWSGEGKRYLVTRAFRSEEKIEMAKYILDKGVFDYSWPDGWRASVTVREVSMPQAGNLRRSADGFCGYDWMVDSICSMGEILSQKDLEDAEAAAMEAAEVDFLSIPM